MYDERGMMELEDMLSTAEAEQERHLRDVGELVGRLEVANATISQQATEIEHLRAEVDRLEFIMVYGLDGK